MSKKIIFITGRHLRCRPRNRPPLHQGRLEGHRHRPPPVPPRRTRRRTGRRFPPLCFDVAKRDVVVEMFANLPEGFKDIDVLLNNAGSSIGQNPAQAGNMDDWDEMIATNINGLLYCTRCVLPGMIERGSGPHRQHRLRRQATAPSSAATCTVPPRLS